MLSPDVKIVFKREFKAGKAMVAMRWYPVYGRQTSQLLYRWAMDRDPAWIAHTPDVLSI